MSIFEQMKKKLLIAMMLVFPAMLSAQSISISGFRLLETDLTAITNGTQEIDQNGEVAAIIKVVTTETGFTFDIGSLGVVGTRQAVGEIWVYVPRRAQKISIFHQQYGVIRNYYFPVPIEGGRTYELVLKVEKEQPVVEKEEPRVEMAVSQTNDYETVYRTYRTLASAGDAAAQFYTGYFLYNGLGVAQNYKEAAEWFRKAAMQGEARASCWLGICYEKGNGMEENMNTAFYWYSKSAEQKNAIAQYYLADCYYRGKGILPDSKQAFYWCKLSAEQSNSDALLLLGDFYRIGEGVKQDYSEARNWYKKALDQGDAAAISKMGDVYMAKKSYDEALSWYIKAIEQDDTRAYSAMGLFAGISNDVVKEIREAFASASEGKAEGQLYLGKLYFEEKYASRNADLAFYWFQKAAGQYNAEAQSFLGECYESGIGVKENGAKAVRCYNDAISQNNVKAMFLLGEYYYKNDLNRDRKMPCSDWEDAI